MYYQFSADDAYRFADHQGIKAHRKGDELHFEYCPNCHGGNGAKRDKYTFSINLNSGQCKCLRSSCGYVGNMVTIAKDFDFELPSEYQEYVKPQKKYRKFKKREKPIEPKNEAIRYLESRGISEATAKRYEITVQNNNPNVLVFPFYDENGNLQYIKYRKTDFDKAKDKGSKEWSEPGCKPILFGMKQCNLENKTLVITEGQMDSLSVIESGIENAVSVPNGCNGFTWIPYCWDWVNNFETIIVFGDYEKGKITLLNDIQRRFKLKIKHVHPEDYRDCKDANDILRKYGKEAVKHAVENAKLVPMRKVIPLNEVQKVDINSLEKMKTGIRELDIALSGGIVFGMLAIIAGKRGDGKSTLASGIIKSALEQNYKCFVYSGELPNHMFRAWLDFQIAGKNHIEKNRGFNGETIGMITNQTTKTLNEWYDDVIYMYDNTITDDDEEQDDLLKIISDTIMQYGVRVILIDNLMTAVEMDASESSDKYDKQSNFVKKLARIALRFNVIIILVAHRRKNSFTKDANDEVSGSADITNLAGYVINYDRDDKIEKSQRKISLTKNRITGRLITDGIVSDYEPLSKRVYTRYEKEDLEYASWELPQRKRNLNVSEQKPSQPHYDWEMNVEDTPFQ